MQNIHRYIQVQEQKGVMQAISLENIKAIRSLGRQKRERKEGPSVMLTVQCLTSVST